MTWTLTHGAVTRTLAAWKISGLVRQRSSQAIDSLQFTAAIDLDGVEPFASEDEIIVSQDGSTWFRGRVTGSRREATGSSETIQYTVAGPWWYLEQLVFQQVWTIRGISLHSSHCLLNTPVIADGSLMGVRQQLAAALQWASDNAAARWGDAPFQWVESELPDVQIPADEVRDVTCAEVIRKQLRWVPDAVSWFDYRTSPPTFRCRRRGDLDSTDLAITDRIASVTLVPRHDLRVPAVVLKYERIDTVDGVQGFSLVTDVAPEGSTGQEFGAFCATIDLVGLTASRARATIEATALPDATDLAAWWLWLKKKEPWLGNPAVTLQAIESIERIPSSDPEAHPLPRELISGQIPDWIAAASQQETVKAKVRLNILGDHEAADEGVREISVNVQTTNAVSGSYNTVTEIVTGESPPVGLAQALYDALSVLVFEGEIVRVTAEIPEDDSIVIGRRLNITGSRAEWASMDAVIQEVAEDVDSGTTRIRVGPPSHLGPRDLVELLRVNRFRMVYTSRATRSGSSASAAGVGLGRDVRLENATSGNTGRSRLKIAHSNAGSIDLDASLAAGHPMGVKEVSICVNGVEKRMLIVCSEPY